MYTKGDGARIGLSECAADAVPYKPKKREQLRSLGYMLQQVEELRGNAQHMELMNVEEILDSACQEILVAWARLRKDCRNGND